MFYHVRPNKYLVHEYVLWLIFLESGKGLIYFYNFPKENRLIPELMSMLCHPIAVITDYIPAAHLFLHPVHQ